jgi:valyl-tRNA synthetase
MSKSKGNVIEPQAIISKYHADALRYWAGGSKLGEDIALQEKELVAGDRFVIKLWNAARFAATHLKGCDLAALLRQEPTEILDQWIQTRLAKTIIEATDAFDRYEYAQAKHAIEQFFWKDFCDNYLELAKMRLYEPKDPGQKQGAQAVIAKCLRAVLSLMAPFTPFITEEIYHAYFHAHEKKPSVHVAGWPEPPRRYETAESFGAIVVAILAAVRKKKSEAKLSMKAPVKRLVIECRQDLTNAFPDLQATINAQEIVLGKAQEPVSLGVKITVEF